MRPGYVRQMSRSSGQPRVSILLPARNAAETLPGCLDSIARQTEHRFECIVVDDASRDATAHIATGFAARDERFRVISGPGNGLVAALTTGLAHCTAPLIARMDADDWMRRRRLELQSAELDQRTELAGVGSHVRLFPRTALSDGRRSYEQWLNGLRTPEELQRDTFVECPLAHPTWMFRRETFERFPYRDCPWPEDYDLLLRALTGGCTFASLPQRLLSWRDSSTRLSRTHANYSQAAFVACKAEHLAKTFLSKHSHYVLWGYGSTGRSLCAALAQCDRFPEHIVDLHPRRIGQNIHGAPVIAPEALPELRRVTQRHDGKPIRILVSVAGSKPRSEIREALSAMHFKEGIDFVCAA